MEISNNISKSETPKVESISNSNSNSSQSLDVKKEAKLENYFNPQDTVEVSKEGREMQKAFSDVKIVKMPENPESINNAESSASNSTTYSPNEVSSKPDNNKMQQIASKIGQGKNVSMAEEKALKENNPQLYAQAKAKLAVQ